MVHGPQEVRPLPPLAAVVAAAVAVIRTVAAAAAIAAAVATACACYLHFSIDQRAPIVIKSSISQIYEVLCIISVLRIASFFHNYRRCHEPALDLVSDAVR